MSSDAVLSAHRAWYSRYFSRLTLPYTENPGFHQMPFYAEDYLQQHADLIRLYCQSRNFPPAQYTYLAHGANNILYRITTGNRRCICKIGINTAFRRLFAEHLIIREHRFFRGFIDYFTDPASGTELLIMPYIHGTHFTSLSPEQIDALGNAIASYHHPVRCIPSIAVENASLFCSNRILPVTATENNTPYYIRFIELLDAALHFTGKPSAIEPPDGSVLVHGDLIPGNIIFTSSGTVRFIDWEGARYDSPEADFATCIKGFNFTESETDRFLAAYGRPVNRHTLFLRLVLHYLQVAAWRMAVQLSIETDEVLFDKAAEELEQELNFIESGLESYRRTVVRL